MTEQEKKQMSMLDIFASNQETFEEAKKKSSEESSKRASYLRLSQDGTYSIRILPLAPVVNANGEVMPMDRKGYEYPLRSFMLKIVDTTKPDNGGKPKIVYVNVCNAKHAFKDRLENDLIDTYVQRACELYANDEALCEKLRKSSFNGGLRFDSKRCMYVVDMEKPGDGIQILQLSYAQYKDLEERKLNVWNKLNKNGKQVSCPISSLTAYPLEIIRKTENKKTNYSFNVDTLADKHELDEDLLQKLFDMPRLPETLYRYTRYHLEATIAYLNQLDEKYDIDVMSDEAVQKCIDQIKMLLPSDDQSHFVMGRDNDGNESGNDLESLYARYDKLDEAGLDDKSAEGQELRASIKEYIEENGLDIKITRSKSNIDLLDEIDKLEAANNADDEEEEEEAPAKPAQRKPSRVEEDEEADDEDDEEPENDDEEDDDDEPAQPSRQRERNDDTNEPAARPQRRAARPQRRR